MAHSSTLSPGAGTRLRGGSDSKPGHAAVAMHAEHRQRGAAIGLAAPAGDAGAAGKVGVDDIDLPHRHAAIRRRFDHLDGSSWPITRG